LIILEKNNLPKNWEWVKIEDISNVVRGASPRPAHSPKFFGGKIPWITVGCLTSDSTPYMKSVSEYLNDAGKKKSRFIPSNTLLLTNSGATLGVPKITKIGGCINDGIVALLSVENPLKKYLYYFLSSKTKSLRNINQGAAQPNLNTKIIKSIELSLPPLNEQKRIVEKIEELFTELDNTKTTLEKTKLQQKQYKESLLKSAFEGKITEKWRDENECSVKSELNILRKINDQKLKSDSKLILETPENIFNLPEISEKWVWVRLGFLSKVITKGSSPKWQGIEYVDKGILFITSENVGSGRILLNKQKFLEKKFNEIQKRSILHRGDILTNIVGASIGRTAIYDLDNTANINQAVSLIRLCDMVNRNYIQYLLNSPFILNYMNLEKVDVARANLSLQNVADFPVPLPSIKEQEQIVLKLEQGFLFIQNSENITNSMLLQLETVRSSILKQAFEGKLVPQNPNDEPASELLKRIKSK